jgi:predicted DNA-binding transcriptional regulator AlpA
MAKSNLQGTALSQPTAVGADSVAEHCERFGISKTTFYELQRQGHGPRVMRVGGRTLVSHAAALEWQRSLEADSEKDAR